MATLTKKNEKTVVPFFKNGVTLDWYAITFPSDVSAKLEATTAGARSPVVAALEAIQSRVSIEVVGSLVDTGTKLVIGVAAIGGAYPTDNYDGTAGTETMAAYLDALVNAAGTHQTVNLASASVAAYVPGEAA
jgi:hypothetical protein